MSKETLLAGALAAGDPEHAGQRPTYRVTLHQGRLDPYPVHEGTLWHETLEKATRAIADCLLFGKRASVEITVHWPNGSSEMIRRVVSCGRARRKGKDE